MSSGRLRTTAPVALACALAAACADVEHRGNVLLITLDTTRADYFGSYGSQLAATPAFDALAAEGVRFANCATASAVTPVSHATILTGRFPYSHGLRVLSADSGARLQEDQWYLPQALREAGYSTAAVHSAFPVSSFFGFGRALDELHELAGELTENENPEKTGWDMDNLQRRSDDTTDIAIDVVGRLSEPFFLWVHYWDPHDVVQVPPEDFLARKGLTPQQAEKKADETYAAEVDWTDLQFGRLVAHLDRLGLWDDTFCVVTADHGEGLSDGLAHHGWRRHRMLYEEQMHVPLLLRLPARLAQHRGRVVEEIVRTADIVPTLLDYLNLPAGSDFDGRSLRTLVEGGKDEPRIAYADQINGYDRNAHMLSKRPDAAFLYVVNDGEWKLTYRPHDPGASELFRISLDPDELKNLYAVRPKQRIRLLTELARREPWVTAPFPPPTDGTAGPDATDALGALGYAASVIADTAWAWTCPEHDGARHASPARCPECDAKPIPVPLDQ